MAVYGQLSRNCHSIACKVDVFESHLITGKEISAAGNISNVISFRAAIPPVNTFSRVCRYRSFLMPPSLPADRHVLKLNKSTSQVAIYMRWSFIVPVMIRLWRGIIAHSFKQSGSSIKRLNLNVALSNIRKLQRERAVLSARETRCHSG